jgi:chromosome partitioning protein
MDGMTESSAMKTVIVTAQKGGSGKTTLVRNLACAALQNVSTCQTVGMIDSDPQGSLTMWWKRREAEKPILAHVGKKGIAPVLGQLREAGAALTIIDTPPSVHDFVTDYLAHADFALLPVKASPDDLFSIADTLALVHQAQVPFAFVLNMAKPRTKLVPEALTELSNHGAVAKPVVHDRSDFATWAITGQSVIEAVPKSKAAQEATQLFSYLHNQLYSRGDAEKGGI